MVKALRSIHILVRFCEEHGFSKPNDIRGIKLMNIAALSVVNSFNEIFMAYGQSDEYSFAFKKDSKIYNRRSEKILTCMNYLCRRGILFHVFICFLLE